jgi:hypothetical protein
MRGRADDGPRKLLVLGELLVSIRRKDVRGAKTDPTERCAAFKGWLFYTVFGALR